LSFEQFGFRSTGNTIAILENVLHHITRLLQDNSGGGVAYLMIMASDAEAFEYTPIDTLTSERLTFHCSLPANCDLETMLSHNDSLLIHAHLNKC
jgi:hypothetical protein